MGARRGTIAWMALAAALGCAPEAEPPDVETCSAAVPCAVGRCVGGWCAQVSVALRVPTRTLRCGDCTRLTGANSPDFACSDSDFLSLGFVTDIAPHHLDLDWALGRVELYVDGELAASMAPGSTRLEYEPAFSDGRCPGLAEGDHMVTGGRMAIDGWIAAEPGTVHVDPGPVFVSAAPDPAVGLPPGPTSVRFRFSEPLGTVSWARKRSSAHTEWYGWPRSLPEPDVLEVALPGSSGVSWVEIQARPFAVDGTPGVPVQVRWTYAVP